MIAWVTQAKRAWSRSIRKRAVSWSLQRITRAEIHDRTLSAAAHHIHSKQPLSLPANVTSQCCGVMDAGSCHQGPADLLLQPQQLLHRGLSEEQAMREGSPFGQKAGCPRSESSHVSTLCSNGSLL